MKYIKTNKVVMYPYTSIIKDKLTFTIIALQDLCIKDSGGAGLWHIHYANGLVQ